MTKDYFSAQNKVLAGVENLAETVRADTKRGNPMNALRTLTKSVDRLLAAEETAKSLGYISLPKALEALAKFKEKPESNYPEDFPEQFYRVPRMWLSGQASTKKTPGFPPMTLAAASRAHRVMMPLLIEAWTLSEGDEEGKQNLLHFYLTTSSEDFTQELYKFIYNIEEDSLEEELIDEVNKRLQEERWEEEAREAYWARLKNPNYIIPDIDIDKL